MPQSTYSEATTEFGGSDINEVASMHERRLAISAECKKFFAAYKEASDLVFDPEDEDIVAERNEADGHQRRIRQELRAHAEATKAIYPLHDPSFVKSFNEAFAFIESKLKRLQRTPYFDPEQPEIPILTRKGS